MPHHIEDGT